MASTKKPALTNGFSNYLKGLDVRLDLLYKVSLRLCPY